MPDSLRSRDRLAELRERVGNYITALMVDGGSNVAACERAMDEAFEVAAALVESQAQELAEAIHERDVYARVQSEMKLLAAERWDDLVRAERRQTVYLDLNARMREALRDALTWIENFPLNAGYSSYHGDWQSLAERLSAALAGEGGPAAGEDG